jgi:hypothetical protein
MATILQEAQAYEPPQTQNIADLEKVHIDAEVKEEIRTNKNPREGESPEFKVKYLEIDDTKYRIPLIVFGQLKELIKVQPEMQWFKVLKSGSGKTGTQYQTIPWK